jgi:hypothetical protein
MYKVPRATRVKRKKITPHLDFYYEHIKTGLLGKHIGYFDNVYAKWGGLCQSMMYTSMCNELLDLFEPTEYDKKWLRWEGYSTVYWGEGRKTGKFGEFTELRQTIVLFMAAMNNEL